MINSCGETTVPPLPVCDLLEWKQTCDHVLSSHAQSTFVNCTVDPSYKESCRSDICPYQGVPDQDTKIKRVICQVVRQAMDTGCDAEDLVPDNLPTYCKGSGFSHIFWFG